MSGLTWQSQNAPFSEDGQSMVLRDIETLFLTVNQLQSQLGISPTGEGTTGGLSAPVNLPPGSTIGGTSPNAVSLPYIQPPPSTVVAVTTPGTDTFTVPPGVFRILVNLVGGGGAGDGTTGTNVFIGDFLIIYTGVICGGGGGSLLAAFDVTPGEVFTYTCPAGGVNGVSNGGTATFVGTGLNLSATGGTNGGHGLQGPGLGGRGAALTPLAAERRAEIITYPGETGSSDGYVSGSSTTGGTASIQRSCPNSGAKASGVLSTVTYKAAVTVGFGTFATSGGAGHVVIAY